LAPASGPYNGPAGYHTGYPAPGPAYGPAMGGVPEAVPRPARQETDSKSRPKLLLAITNTSDDEDNNPAGGEDQRPVDTLQNGSTDPKKRSLTDERCDQILERIEKSDPNTYKLAKRLVTKTVQPVLGKFTEDFNKKLVEQKNQTSDEIVRNFETGVRHTTDKFNELKGELTANYVSHDQAGTQFVSREEFETNRKRLRTVEGVIQHLLDSGMVAPKGAGAAKGSGAAGGAAMASGAAGAAAMGSGAAGGAVGTAPYHSPNTTATKFCQDNGIDLSLSGYFMKSASRALPRGEMNMIAQDMDINPDRYPAIP